MRPCGATSHRKSTCLRFSYKVFTQPSVLIIPSTLLRFLVPDILKCPHGLIFPALFHCGDGVLVVVGFSLLSPNISSVSVAKEL